MTAKTKVTGGHLETWVRSLGWEDSLVDDMTTHSIILAWEIPWTEEPVRLYSPWDRKRVRHDLVTKQQQGYVASDFIFQQFLWICSLFFFFKQPHQKNVWYCFK